MVACKVLKIFVILIVILVLASVPITIARFPYINLVSFRNHSVVVHLVEI